MRYFDGTILGWLLLGDSEGWSVGSHDGLLLGLSEGTSVGIDDGIMDGTDA